MTYICQSEQLKRDMLLLSRKSLQGRDPGFEIMVKRGNDEAIAFNIPDALLELSENSSNFSDFCQRQLSPL